MKTVALPMWKEDEGVLTFEWILLLTLLTIGIVSGLTAVRDATITELGDVAQAMISLDQSYTIDYPLSVSVHVNDNTLASDSRYLDATGLFDHCRREEGLMDPAPTQGPQTDCNKLPLGGNP